MNILEFGFYNLSAICRLQFNRSERFYLRGLINADIKKRIEYFGCQDDVRYCLSLSSIQSLLSKLDALETHDSLVKDYCDCLVSGDTSKSILSRQFLQLEFPPAGGDSVD